MSAAERRAVVAGQEVAAGVRRTVLPGGVRVVSENMPGLRSATLGMWVGVGSRDETADCYGSTHFLEHLLFKGTARRDALSIAEAFDSVGGEANAATSKEHTCYFARVSDVDLPMAVDVIGDMVANASLSPHEVDVERGVILEELAMNEDDPGDVAHERFAEVVMDPNPLARPIGGTPQAIREVSRERIDEHYRQHYIPPGLVITAAGGVDHDALCELVASALGEWVGADAAPLPARGPGSIETFTDGTILTVQRPIEQAHVLLGGLGLVATDPRRYAMSVLTTVLGGGMSSRLFQEVRERRGLAYSVYSFAAGYSDSGYYGMYAACTPAHVAEVVDVLTDQWRQVAEHSITAHELERGIGQLCGSLVLGLEDSGSRMSRLGKSELVYGEYVTLDEALRRIRAVTVEDVQSLAAELGARPRSLVTVGPMDEDPVTSLG
ncbi:MAG: M16 family metallopeptidase [Actinomycetales bacterium]